MKTIAIYFISSFLLLTVGCTSKKQTENTVESEQLIKVSTKKRIASPSGDGSFIVIDSIQHWKPSETAVLISDMWDKHWCPPATARVAELAPVLNNVVSIIRSKGGVIVHAPSELMEYYKDHPARVRAMQYSGKDFVQFTNGVEKLPTEAGAEWPFDPNDEGCEDHNANPHRVWSKQIDALKIADEDLITADGAQIGAFFNSHGIKNVIMMGVHTNMCVMHRTYGLRTMKRLGMNVVLVRDLTDLMYDPARYPYTSHWNGLNLMIEYIEKYVCPTVTSSDFTGEAPFVFSEAKNENKGS